MSNEKIVLVSGPARSGKSEWAEYLAIASGDPVIYLATAQANPEDQEWTARLDRHQERRPDSWTTWNIPIDLVGSLMVSSIDDCVLVDSLGTWVANCLEQPDPDWENTVKNFLQCLQQSQSRVILVAEEVGWGVVPAYSSGRHFRDRLGNLVRRISPLAGKTYLVTAGYVIDLSQWGQLLPSMQ